MYWKHSYVGNHSYVFSFDDAVICRLTVGNRNFCLPSLEYECWWCGRDGVEAMFEAIQVVDGAQTVVGIGGDMYKAENGKWDKNDRLLNGKLD